MSLEKTSCPETGVLASGKLEDGVLYNDSLVASVLPYTNS